MKVLVIDDDTTFARLLARGLTRHGFQTETAASADRALAIAADWQPEHAVLDLKLDATPQAPGDSIDNGLDLIAPLLDRVPQLRIVVLTGYASIATTVTAIKRGAAGYLAKPVDAATVAAALTTDAQPADAPQAPMSLKRLEWEHIQRVLAEHDGNVSAAARTLGLYRRTLQRKLDKRPVKR